MEGESRFISKPSNEDQIATPAVSDFDVAREKNVGFGILEPKEAIEVVGELRGALIDNDPDKVREILLESEQSVKVRETLIANRDAGQFPNPILIEGVNVLIRKRFGDGATAGSLSPEQLIELMKDGEIPAEAMLNVAQAAFHSKQGDVFNKIINTILSREKELDDPLAVAWAKHHLAAWKEKYEHDSATSFALNQEIRRDFRDIISMNLAGRIKFGTAFTAKNPPSKKAKEFKAVAEQMRSAGDVVNSLRADQERADNLIKVAVIQLSSGKEDELAEQNIQEAVYLAIRSFEGGEDMGYTNVQKRSLEVLNFAYNTLFKLTKNPDDVKMARNIEARLKKLEAKYRYA